MEVSKECIKAIKQFEGLRLMAYRCPAGVWTIGYGHTGGVKPGEVITTEYAEKLLKIDLMPIESYLSTVREIRTQGQFDACADFCYNLGVGAFKGSTLLKRICAGGTDAEIGKEFRKWIYSGKKVLPGLVTRREWEVTRWCEYENENENG